MALPGVLTAAAKRVAAARLGFSHSSTESRCDPATAPMAGACAVNGAPLPARIVSAGLGGVCAMALAPVVVMPATAAVAAMAPSVILNLDMVSLT